MLKLDKAEDTFVFDNVSDKPILSLLRDFSAPVKLLYERSQADLAFLMAHDTDSFNAWDAADKLSSQVILTLARDSKGQGSAGVEACELPSSYVDAVRSLLKTALVSNSVHNECICYLTYSIHSGWRQGPLSSSIRLATTRYAYVCIGVIGLSY